MNVYIKSPSLSRGGDFYCLLAGGESGKSSFCAVRGSPYSFSFIHEDFLFVIYFV